MTIREIRVDEELWNQATALRRAEWRATIEDLVQDGQLAPKYTGYFVLAKVSPDAAELEFLDDEGELREAVTIPFAITAHILSEYLQIITRMDSEAHETGRLEALDMGKKVVHDTAARALAQALPELAANHATYRKLFSMLVALQVDTTKLIHARAHLFRDQEP
ncbi:UPF0262 family protein [Pendulispora brunnea]|uniref:UPF0262 family protein n=1 Tax=Pendulispora brunnea TaxID=2905690 RepID=A0ABZ2KPX6_9BACT